MLAFETIEDLAESIMNLRHTGNHPINGQLVEIDAMSITLLS